MFVFSEFEVEGVPVSQQSLSQLEVRGQGEEPVWRTQLSPDSACSEGSAGSLEQQHDPGQSLTLYRKLKTEPHSPRGEFQNKSPQNNIRLKSINKSINIRLK